MQKTPRPLQVVRLMPVMDYGGVESIVTVLAERLDRDDFSLRVCTFWKDGEAAARVRASGIPCDVLGVDPRLRNPLATLKLCAYLLKHRPAILHASISEANFHASVVARFFPGLLLILEEVGTPDRSKRARRLFRHVYRRAQRIIGVSEATRRYLVEVEGAPEEKVVRIYNCVDAEFFDAHPRRTDPNALNVGVVGRLVKEKNHRTLFAAWQTFAAETDRPARLHVVGDGPMRTDLEALAHELGGEDSIVFHGFRADVSTFLETLDVVVLPSTHEGYGMVLVEAMAQAIPVIGTTAGGVPEVLEGYPDEWLVDPLDRHGWLTALRRLASLDAQDRAALGERARRLVSARFTPDAYAAEIARLYRAVAQDRPVPQD